jgi:hypothetical protein
MTDGAPPRRAHGRRATTVLPGLVLLAALAVTSALAQPVHRSVDAQGNVRYSAFPPSTDAAADAPAALPGPAARLGLAPVREQPASADEMLGLSGLRALLPELLREVAGHLTRGSGELSPRERTAVRGVAERTFEPTRAYAVVRDEYERRSAPERRAAVAAWLRSPGGRRIVALQAAGVRTADPAAVSAFTQRLQQHPPPAARLELIERLDWATGSSELSTDLVLAVHRGLALGVSRTLPREQRPRPGQLDAELDERRPAMLSAVRTAMRVRLLYVFRDVTDADLRDYVDFESSADARAHNRAVRHALLHALTLTAERTGTVLARTLPRAPDASPR